MKMVVFGSLNIDKTYSLTDFVHPGETVSALKMEQFCGGKGFNQAVALRRAGNEVCFAGAVGADGDFLLDALDRNGIDRTFVKQTAGATGHAIIQLDARGQNCIIILAGANGEITPADVEKTLAAFRAGIRTLLIPKENVKDLEDIPPHVLSQFRVVTAEIIDDVLKTALVAIPGKEK